ncbi:unnamed protein product [Paramecium sonneborni]|uniref:Transmembrane protein n=1 Tax=Paramecium sonneborni TaxID=65129 RepID=A0A8S1RAM2_9CILI|nr:unnamed protein product [Paramecium sonneborni]
MNSSPYIVKRKQRVGDWICGAIDVISCRIRNVPNNNFEVFELWFSSIMKNQQRVLMNYQKTKQIQSLNQAFWCWIWINFEFTIFLYFFSALIESIIIQQIYLRNMSDLRLLHQNKSLHHFQNTFFKQEQSPSKSHRKQLEQHGSPNNLSTSLSISKTLINKPQSETSYLYYLLQQIRHLEQTIEELKQENQLLKSQQKIGFLDLQFQHKQMNKYHNLLKSVQQVKLDNIKLRKSIEQMNLMMKIHLKPVNEMFLKLIPQENNYIESFNHVQNDSINESKQNLKIHANINKYQKCKTESQIKDQK